MKHNQDTYPYRQGRRIEQENDSTNVLAVVICIMTGGIAGAYAVSLFDQILRGWAY